MKYIIICIFLALTNCAYSSKYIHPSPKKSDVYSALNIIIDEFDTDGLYTRRQMLYALSGYKLKKHSKCSSKAHKIQIVFKTGSWSEENGRYCIYSEAPHLKGQCLVGLFNGEHTINIINKIEIHKTSFAHELLHYFQKYIDGAPAKHHYPKLLWKGYVGYGYGDNGIGYINEILKEKGF